MLVSRRCCVCSGVGFGDQAAKKAAPAVDDKDKGPAPRKVKVMGGLVDADKKWCLEAYDVDEWKVRAVRLYGSS